MRTVLKQEDKCLDLSLKHLKPIRSVDAEVISSLVRELDHDEFERRETASSKLREMRDSVEGILAKALEDNKLSLETRARLRVILKGIEGSEKRLLQSRLLVVLEKLSTQGAVKQLESTACGDGDAWLTREARSALDRVKRDGGAWKTLHQR
jgi:hypothetical protein